MKKTKVFAAYLPQFHETEDNNKFWGEGFTDWVGVKKAEPMFPGHMQPKVPLNNNYYDLSEADTIRKQAEMAREYGVSGFNIYHYWFKDGKQELQKPAELLLDNKDIDIEFFFSWDNVAWKRTWSNMLGNAWAPLFDNNSKSTKEVVSTLVEFEYGNEMQWKKHFEYLSQFFLDTRYLKIDNKPVFAFMSANDYLTLKDMAEFWQSLAKESGFDGVYFIIQKATFIDRLKLDNTFYYEPAYSAWGKKENIEARIKKLFHLSLPNRGEVKYIYQYDKIWRKILKNSKKKNNIAGGFVKFDDTPRRGKQARVIIGETPEKFGKYFGELYKACCLKNQDIVLLTAWNEWGEGAFLEPDKQDGYAYLEALKQVVERISV